VSHKFILRAFPYLYFGVAAGAEQIFKIYNRVKMKR
jgi:hypothetical protein